MMTDIIKTLTATFEVIERDDQRIQISIKNYDPYMIFNNRHEMYEFLDKLTKILPRQDGKDLSESYIGTPGKYDRF